MRPNQLRATLSAGKPAFGTMIQELTSTVVPILLAHAGYDFAFIDMEHGPFSLESATELIRTLRLTGLTPLVRVPDGQYHLISRVLDAGAEGFMVPRVETRAQVEYIVSCAKYPPVGKRGASIAKGHNDFQKADLYEFTQTMNRENLVILQIERKEAVDAIDDLLSVPGVDAVIIGPKDLALSIGRPQDFNDPETQAAIAKVLESGLRHAVHVGLHTAQISTLLEWYQKGMRLLTWSTDLEMLKTASESGLSQLKAGTQPKA
jgi:2-dehydro-3-deoxyglucarate aldolase/4-hydroxy-2-oxoheptanedioate aldolase